MYEELLHELYLSLIKVKDETINKYNNTGALKVLGVRIIRNLYQRKDDKRVSEKCRRDLTYNPLNEIRSVEQIQVTIDPDCFEDELERRNKDRKLDTMNALINLNRDNEKVQLLVMVANEGATVVAKELGISRQRVYYKMNEIKQTLKEHIGK